MKQRLRTVSSGDFNVQHIYLVTNHNSNCGLALAFSDRLRSLIVALEWYANREHWIPANQMDNSRIENDGGRRAHEALAKLNGK